MHLFSSIHRFLYRASHWIYSLRVESLITSHIRDRFISPSSHLGFNQDILSLITLTHVIPFLPSFLSSLLHSFHPIFLPWLPSLTSSLDFVPSFLPWFPSFTSFLHFLPSFHHSFFSSLFVPSLIFFSFFSTSVLCSFLQSLTSLLPYLLPYLLIYLLILTIILWFVFLFFHIPSLLLTLIVFNTYCPSFHIQGLFVPGSLNGQETLLCALSQSKLSSLVRKRMRKKDR